MASDPGNSSLWTYNPGGNGGTGQWYMNGAYGGGPNNNTGTAAGGYGGPGGTVGRPGSAGITGSTYSPGIIITNWPNGSGGPAGAAGTTYYSSDGDDGPSGYSVKGTSLVKFVSNGTLVGSTSST
jgi:hypothetical protein